MYLIIVLSKIYENDSTYTCQELDTKQDSLYFVNCDSNTIGNFPDHLPRHFLSVPMMLCKSSRLPTSSFRLVIPSFRISYKRDYTQERLPTSQIVRCSFIHIILLVISVAVYHDNFVLNLKVLCWTSCIYFTSNNAVLTTYFQG